jgi:HJR/Mrr/RecB family endonuclease
MNDFTPKREAQDRVKRLCRFLDSGDVAALFECPPITKFLSPKEERVLRMLRGWGCEREFKPIEIALEFNISRQTVYRTHKRALARMEQIGMDEQIIRRVVALAHTLRNQALWVLPTGRRPFEISCAVERLIDEAKISREQLLSLSPRGFEEFIAEIWNRFGYKVELTARTRDGGRDVVAVKKAESELRYIIECKRYHVSHKVGVELIRSLYGVKTHDRATKAFLATTSTFTRGAVQFWEPHRWELELKDYDGVREWAIAAAKHHKQSFTARVSPLLRARKVAAITRPPEVEGGRPARSGAPARAN